MATKQIEGRKTAPVERRSRFSTAVDEEAMEFIKAIESFKAAKQRPFPSWTEVLDIVRALGYRKVAEPTPIADIATPRPDEDAG